MSRFVTDTHALLWHLADNPELSSAASATFRLADAGQAEIIIPSIVLSDPGDLVIQANPRLHGAPICTLSRV